MWIPRTPGSCSRAWKMSSYRVEWRVTSVDGHVVEDVRLQRNPEASAADGGSRSGAKNTGQPEEACGRGEPERVGPQKAGGLDQTLVGALTFGVLGLLALALMVARWLRHRQSRGIQ